MDSHERVTLEIGGRQFQTIVGTLTHRSEYFKAAFSGRYAIKKEGHDSSFIDADPALFDHILRYLRRGIFPLVYDKTKGHDYALYTQILEEAKYFQCPTLIVWLEDSCYHKCISWNVNMKLSDAPDGRTHGDSKVESLPPIPHVMETDKIYLCPRGIYKHKGDEGACGRQCKLVQGDNEVEYVTQQATTTWVTAEREICFNRGWMTDNG